MVSQKISFEAYSLRILGKFEGFPLLDAGLFDVEILIKWLVISLRLVSADLYFTLSFFKFVEHGNFEDVLSFFRVWVEGGGRR